MVAEIRLNNTWQDISDSIIQPITIDRRVDEVLDSGTFTFVSKTIDYNIPPLTLCNIDGEYWLCSSECNEVIPSNPKEYNHNVSLIELTYYLQCYIVGTKAMSNTGTMYPTNADKCKALCDIVNDKYRLIFGNTAVKFQFEIGAFSDSRWQLEREFIFGFGTTLFQALLDIGRTCNAIPRIASAPYFDGTSEILYLSWDILDYNQTFTLDSTKILTMQYRQSVDDYTAILESEVNDVVDRTTTTIVNNLSVRSESYIIEDDNQVLMLPSRVESVKKLEVFNTNLGIQRITGIENYIDKKQATLNNGLTKNIYNWFDSNLFNSEIEDFYTFKDNLTSFLVNNGLDQVQLKFVVVGVDPNLTYYFETRDGVTVLDLTKYCIEKNQYDLLTVEEKPKYCYYTYGDNVIRGIYKYAHDDFWGAFLSQTVKPLIYETINNNPTSVEIIYKTVNLETVWNTNVLTEDDYNPKNLLFNIEYTPITSLFLLSSNDKEPFNEDEIKPTSRSFELSSSMSDFDLLVKSIDKNNKMMGLPEVSISYYGNNYPKPMNSITIKNQTYYVSSVQTTIVLDKYTSVINLVKEYNKIAEVFGVKTQFESTRLPLNSIIDRIVYCGEYQCSDMPTGLNIKYGSSSLYLRGSIVSNSNINYIICEAQDNYAIATQKASNSSLNSKMYENKQIPYSNSNSEQVKYTFNLLKEPDNINYNLDHLKEIANDYPLLTRSSAFTQVSDEKEVKIYKDARERLIFVLKLV